MALSLLGGAQGPEDGWPGLHDSTIRRFLSKHEMSCRRRHMRRRTQVPEGSMEAFTPLMMGLSRVVPARDILRADYTVAR